MPEQDPVPGKPGTRAGIAAARAKKAAGNAGSFTRYAQGHARRCVSPEGAQWTDEAEEEFLDCLASSGNVSWSCNEAGVTYGVVYRQRRIRADFAAKWDAALDQAYARLEFEYVNTAFDSLTLKEFDATRPIPRMTADQVARALSIYKASKERGRRGGSEARPRSTEELRAEILKKVRAIRNARK